MSKAAATEESTPPDIATTTLGMVYVYTYTGKQVQTSSTTCLSCRVILFKNLASIFDGKVPADFGLLLIAGCFPGNDFCGQVPFRGNATGQALSGYYAEFDLGHI